MVHSSLHCLLKFHHYTTKVTVKAIYSLLGIIKKYSNLEPDMLMKLYIIIVCYTGLLTGWGMRGELEHFALVRSRRLGAHLIAQNQNTLIEQSP